MTNGGQTSTFSSRHSAMGQPLFATPGEYLVLEHAVEGREQDQGDQWTPEQGVENIWMLGAKAGRAWNR